jgi:hypothetical protein
MHLDEPGVPFVAARPADRLVALRDVDWAMDWARDLPQHPCLTLELHQVLLSVFMR